MVVGALKQETVSLVCSVESHPAPLIFHWTFNNSGELVEVPHSRYSHVAAVGTPSVAENLKEYPQFHGSRLNYTPATEMDYGTVACWASNQVGKQRTPCLFQVNAFLSFILRCTSSLQFSELFTTRYYLKWTILGILGIENNLNTFIVVWIYTACAIYIYIIKNTRKLDRLFLQMNGLVMILFFMIVRNIYSKIYALHVHFL